jgi:hypothetical protein
LALAGVVALADRISPEVTAEILFLGQLLLLAAAAAARLTLMREGLGGPVVVVVDLALALAALGYPGKEIQAEQALL